MLVRIWDRGFLGEKGSTPLSRRDGIGMTCHGEWRRILRISLFLEEVVEDVVLRGLLRIGEGLGVSGLGAGMRWSA